MNKTDAYRETLQGLSEWDGYLLAESGLPGRRANIELACAVAEQGDQELFRRLASYDAGRAPTSNPLEFLAFCGVLGLGTMLARGHAEVMPLLRRHASDPRWRIREAVVMALQRLGKIDLECLVREMRHWSGGSLLERRAAVAALCDPGQLGNERHAQRVLRTLETMTTSLCEEDNRRTQDFKVLRKGLGYCWSIVVVALPERGREAMERWFACSDRDVAWIMKENLRKERLARMDSDWVAAARTRLGMSE